MPSPDSLTTCGSFRGHRLIVDRLRRSLYYGKIKEESEVTDCPSLPLTEVTVDVFERALKQQSGRKCTGSIGRGLSVLDVNYAASVSKKACISPCSIVLAMIYIERLAKKNPDYLKTGSPTDLFLVSMLVASKFLYDDGTDEEVMSSEWAASGFMELDRLIKLELEFLVAIDWDLHVTPVHFFEKLSVIEHLVTWKQTRLRSASGGYTYQEILSLERGCLQWNVIIENLLKTVAVTLLTYSVVLIAVFSASLVASSLHPVRLNAISNQPTFPVSTPLSLSLVGNQSHTFAHDFYCRFASSRCNRSCRQRYSSPLTPFSLTLQLPST